jgi:tRNA pseudouridine55 synthase
MTTLPNFAEGACLLIDKPLTWTSFDVVNKIRYALRAHTNQKHKVGHAGTLDPLASGLLIICTGKMTKNIESYQALEKEYTGTIVLGKTTPSYDLETEVDQELPIDHLTEAQVRAVIPQFLGEQSQLPPMFSAVKVDGKRLYQHARKGQEVQRDPRPIHIYSLEFTRIALPEVDFRVCCSKGTYVRTLAHDIGAALGVGGHLSALRRTAIGEFRIEQAQALNEFLEVIGSRPSQPKNPTL